MPLDPNSPTPVYLQIAAQLTGRIESGQYPPGSRLPSQVDLLAEFEVARMTLVSAPRLLSTQGLIVGVQGRGTFVRTDTTSTGDTVRRADVLALAEHLETSLGYRAMSTVEVIQCVAGTLRRLAG